MPTTREPRPRPGDEPGLEARLRAELGAGGLPADVRGHQLSRLQALAEELGPPATAGDTASDDETTPLVASGAQAVGGDGSGSGADESSAMARARRRWFAASAPPRAAAASVATFAVLILGAGSAVAASAGALPGETMYPVKQAVEQVQVAASWSADREVAAYLDVADTRLDEASRLVAGEGELDQLPPTLDRHEEALAAAAERAGDEPELARTVDEATAAATTRLAELRDELPDTASPQARAALDRALQRLQDPGRQPQGGSDAPERSPRGDESAPGEPGQPGEPGEPGQPESPPQPGPEPRPEPGRKPGQEPGVRQDRGAPADPGGVEDRGARDRGGHEPDTSGDPGPPESPGDPDGSAGASEQGQPDEPAATDTGPALEFDVQQQHRTRPFDDADGSQDSGRTGSTSYDSSSDQRGSELSTSAHADGAYGEPADDADGGR